MGEAGQKPPRMATAGELEAHDPISAIDDKAVVETRKFGAPKQSLVEIN